MGYAKYYSNDADGYLTTTYVVDNTYDMLCGSVSSTPEQNDSRYDEHIILVFDLWKPADFAGAYAKVPGENAKIYKAVLGMYCLEATGDLHAGQPKVYVADNITDQLVTTDYGDVITAGVTIGSVGFSVGQKTWTMTKDAQIAEINDSLPWASVLNFEMKIQWGGPISQATESVWGARENAIAAYRPYLELWWRGDAYPFHLMTKTGKK